MTGLVLEVETDQPVQTLLHLSSDNLQLVRTNHAGENGNSIRIERRPQIVKIGQTGSTIVTVDIVVGKCPSK